MKITVLSAIALAAIAAAPAAAAPYANSGDISAYVADWAIGSQFTNYAFDTATSTFVGSWQVDQGPNWSTVPQSYSGLTAAALLFGGSASDYFISTVDNVAANADHLAWVSTYGGACGGAFPCGTKVAETLGAAVAGVPEPATWALMVTGFGLVGLGVRRRRTAIAA